MKTPTDFGVLLQVPATHETRAVRVACMLLDVPILSTTLEGLLDSATLYGPKLGAGLLLPVGSVEFVRDAMRLGGLAEPIPAGFPERLQPWYGRHIRRAAAGSVAGRWFVKPVRTKEFNGFVFDSMRPPDELSEYDREQHAAFTALPPHAQVWVSDPVNFVSEWRFYVRGGEILGSARYDSEGADEAAVPDRHQVLEMIRVLGPRAPYGLDVGVLDTGETAFVEVNDAWALGLYGQAMEAKSYYGMLREYWSTAVGGET